MHARLRLVRELRDLIIVDSAGVRCGVADEVEFEGGPGEPLRVVAILVGPGAWERRLPPWLFAVVRRLGGRAWARIPWTKVAHVTGRVTLAVRAEDLGLGVADRRLKRPLSRIPMG